MNILRFPTVRSAGGPSGPSDADVRADADDRDPPIQPALMILSGPNQPELRVLMAVTMFQRSSIEMLLARNDRARDILAQLRPIES